MERFPNRPGYRCPEQFLVPVHQNHRLQEGSHQRVERIHRWPEDQQAQGCHRRAERTHLERIHRWPEDQQEQGFHRRAGRIHRAGVRHRREVMQERGKSLQQQEEPHRCREERQPEVHRPEPEPESILPGVAHRREERIPPTQEAFPLGSRPLGLERRERERGFYRIREPAGRARVT
jgi:hypothetical protein